MLEYGCHQRELRAVHNNTLDINYYEYEQDYVDAIRRAIDHQLTRPRSNAIDPGLVTYAHATHNYRALDMADRYRLNALRSEVSRIELNHAQWRRTFHMRGTPEPNDGEAKCPICFEELRLRTSVALIPCGHVYCNVCIDGYMAGQPYNAPITCPTCRERLRRGRVLRLYVSYMKDE